MSDLQKPKAKRRLFLRRQLLILALPLAGVLSFWGKANPEWVEHHYSTTFYHGLSQTVSTLTGLVPFSMAEVCIASLILFALWMIVRMIRGLRDKEQKIFDVLNRFFSTAAAIASVICLLFVMNCGLNYSRYSFTTYSGLTIRDSSAQELAALCAELIEEANELRPLITEDETGVTVLTASDYETAAKTKAAFDTLSQQYPVLQGSYAQPKPVFFSKLMSYTQITGFFFPYTFEANINVAAPDYTIPATMCHELAHLRGFMREDEANFVSYLACMASEDTELRYSGTMLALVHSMNSLYGADFETFCALNALYHPGVSRDFTYNNWYWQQYEGAVAEVSDKINDTYLKVNHQTDGVKSYGRMVDLLLADYRARHGLT